MTHRLTEADIRRLAQRWREHQASITGHPVPTVPPYLQAIADHCDAGLLLALAPHLASPFTAQSSEATNHV